MTGLKAIISGVIFILVAAMLMQLAYIFLAVGYNSLSKEYPFLNEISGIFRYLIAIPVFLGIMFLGGYLTAAIANTRVLLYCLIVGIITSGGMMWMALQNAEITLVGIIINTLTLFATVAGGFFWQKKNPQYLS